MTSTYHCSATQTENKLTARVSQSHTMITPGTLSQKLKTLPGYN